MSKVSLGSRAVCHHRLLLDWSEVCLGRPSQLATILWPNKPLHPGQVQLLAKANMTNRAMENGRNPLSIAEHPRWSQQWGGRLQPHNRGHPYEKVVRSSPLIARDSPRRSSSTKLISNKAGAARPSTRGGMIPTRSSPRNSTKLFIVAKGQVMVEVRELNPKGHGSIPDQQGWSLEDLGRQKSRRGPWLLEQSVIKIKSESSISHLSIAMDVGIWDTRGLKYRL